MEVSFAGGWRVNASPQFTDWLQLSEQKSPLKFIELLEATRGSGISKSATDRALSLERAAGLRCRNLIHFPRNVYRRNLEDGIACWILHGMTETGAVRQVRYLDGNLSCNDRLAIKALEDESRRLDIGQDRAAALQATKGGQLITLNHAMADLVEEGIVEIRGEHDAISILNRPLYTDLAKVNSGRHRPFIVKAAGRSLFLRMAWQWDHRNLKALYHVRIIDLSARPPIPMEAWPTTINPANRLTASILSWGDLTYLDVGMIRDHFEQTKRTRQATITSVRQVLNGLSITSYEEFQSKLRVGLLFGSSP